MNVLEHIESATIVLVEDDPGHSTLVQRNLRRANFLGNIIVFNTGQQANEYLFDAADDATPVQAPPLLVVLDLNLPEMSGYLLLQCIKNNEQAKHIPVVILSAVDDHYAIERCYALGCNAYVIKPVDYRLFSEAVEKIAHLLGIAQVPVRV